MLSVHRLQAAFYSRARVNPRQMLITRSVKITRQRSSIQPRKANLLTQESSPSSQQNSRLWGPFLFTIGVLVNEKFRIPCLVCIV